MRGTAGVAVALALAMVSAWGAPARVEAVQSPAWLERDGKSVPLVPGTELLPRDRLLTGTNARVRLALPEGSAIKLGENTQLVLEKAEDGAAFKGALRVLAGAFRFTTRDSDRPRARDIAIRVKDVSIGVRGTDLWGKGTAERDWVVLLEGRINVASEGHAGVVLDQPNAMFQQQAGRAPSVSAADPAQVAAWSEETEIPQDASQAERAPRGWKVVAAMMPSRDAGRALVRQLRAAGYAAEPRQVEGYHLVEVLRLESESHAREVMANLRAQPGVSMPKVVPMP